MIVNEMEINMNNTDEEHVILEGGRDELDENGILKNHPLRFLYYFYDDGREPTNVNELTFTGDNLYRSQILNDVQLFDLIFHGEPPEEVYKEEWANPLRAEVLKRLSGNGRSWYISFVNHFMDIFIENMGKPLSQKLNDYLTEEGLKFPDYWEDRKAQEFIDYYLQKDPGQIAVLDSGVPFGYGKGLMKRLFIEVPNEEIEQVAGMVWPGAWETYTIQGYNFPSGRIDMLKQWERKVWDDYLFREILDETQVFFNTWPAEHRHFQFFTNKYTFDEFQHAIQLDDLKSKARRILEERNDLRI